MILCYCVFVIVNEEQVSGRDLLVVVDLEQICPYNNNNNKISLQTLWTTLNVDSEKVFTRGEDSPISTHFNVFQRC